MNVGILMLSFALTVKSNHIYIANLFLLAVDDSCQEILKSILMYNILVYLSTLMETCLFPDRKLAFSSGLLRAVNNDRDDY